MRAPDRLLGPVPDTFFPLVAFLLLIPVLGFAGPVTITLKPSGEKVCAVNAPGGSLLVSISLNSQKLHAATLPSADSKKTLSLLGHDRITKLCFFKDPAPDREANLPWKTFFSAERPQALSAKSPGKLIPCQFQAWVNQINGKVLPLALIKVGFAGPIPLAGTPLIDSDGQVVALILQPAPGSAAYAIPCQAVNRVHGDIIDHRKLVRGWLGFSLSTDSNTPRIVSVLPGSPAAKAKLRPNDVLLRAGRFDTQSYPEAVNALFYTKPGETTSIKVRRDDQIIPCKVIPVSQRPGG